MEFLSALCFLSFGLTLLLLAAFWTELTTDAIDLHFQDSATKDRVFLTRKEKRLALLVTIFFPVPLWIFMWVMEASKYKRKPEDFWVWAFKKIRKWTTR